MLPFPAWQVDPSQLAPREQVHRQTEQLVLWTPGSWAKAQVRGTTGYGQHGPALSQALETRKRRQGSCLVRFSVCGIKGIGIFSLFCLLYSLGETVKKVHELVENERRLDGLAWVSPLGFSRLTHEPAVESRLGRC